MGAEHNTSLQDKELVLREQVMGVYHERVAETTPQGPPASTRDNLIHMIGNTNDRINGLASGKYVWGKLDPELYSLSKEDLLLKLIDADTRLFNLANFFAGQDHQVEMPYGKILSPVQFISGMIPHQIFHQGIHLGIMDKLGMSRPDTYRKRWGD